MESLEQKNASAGPEEPIKSEELVASPDNSERNSNLASPPPNCSICLGKLINTSFTDSCLHQFCFTCLLQWSKIKTECPLCKQTFKSIIHNVRSEEDYDQYNVQITHQVTATLDVAADIHISGGGLAMWQSIANRNTLRPFMYRTTMGPGRRYGALLNPQAVGRREQIPNYSSFISNPERRRRSNAIQFRHSVYRHGSYSIVNRDIIGGTRECSPEFYRRNPTETDRLISWLNRELQVLLNDNAPHISYVMNIIMDLITQYEIRSPEFRDRIRPYFGARTSHFVHEFYNFASSNYDLRGYDQAVIYPQSNGLTHDYVPNIVSPAPSTSSSSSQDSDVRILGGGFNFFNPLPSGPYVFDLPGPSTVGQVFRMQNSHIPDVLTISSTSSSSENECEVVGYVKPRHERTPEIIDLNSSEDEIPANIENSTTNSAINISNEESIPDNTVAVEEENHPSTSYDVIKRRTRRKAEQAKVQIYELLNSTSSGSDSEYEPNRRLRPLRLRRKTCSKKSKKTSEQKTKKKKGTTSKQNKVSDKESSDSENDEYNRYQANKNLINEKSKKNDKRKKSRRGKRKSNVSCSKLRNKPSKRFKKNSSYSSNSSASSSNEQETFQRKNYLSNESNQSDNESLYKNKKRNCKKNCRLSESETSSSDSSSHSNRSSKNNYNYESHNFDGSDEQHTSDQINTDFEKNDSTIFSSSKSDVSVSQEHSNLNKNSVSKDKYRSHKKHKDSKS